MIGKDFSRFFLLSLILLSVSNTSLIPSINAQTQSNWNLPLTYSIREISYPLEFAVNSQATNDFELEYDIPAPPQPPMGLYVYIQNESPGIISNYLKSTIPPNYPITWQLVIKSITVNDHLTLEWNTPVNSIPEDIDLILSNSTHTFTLKDTSMITINIKAGTTYRYSLQAQRTNIAPQQELPKPTKPENIDPIKISKLTASETVELLISENITNAAYILSNTIQTKAPLIQNLLESNHIETVAQILIITNTDVTKEIFLQLEPTICAKLIIEMSKIDLQATAQKVEDAVKHSIQEQNETLKQEKIKNLTQSIIQMDKESLIALLSSIAKLPETPSTVSRILENLTPEESATILHDWIGSNDYTGLSEVVYSLQHDYLLVVYPVLGSVDRNILKSLVPLETILVLHTLNNAEIIDVYLENTTYYETETVPVIATIMNTGVDTFEYLINLLLDNDFLLYHTSTVPESTIINTTIALSNLNPGVHQIKLENYTRTITILKTPEPIFECIRLLLTNNSPIIGEKMNITLYLKNFGDTGSDTVIVLLDDQVIHQSTLKLKQNQNTVLEIPVNNRNIGDHTITVFNQQLTYTVSKPQYNILWYLVATVLTVGILTVIYKARQFL